MPPTEPTAPAPPAAERPPAKPPRPRSRRTPERPCLNCGDTTVGNFCPSCGQRKVEVRVSFRRMVLEALDDQLALNSTLPRTLGALFFRPGHLTAEYAGGRIARYIPPFRLYLVCSVVFFLVLSLLPDVRNPVVNEEVRVGGARAGVQVTPDSAEVDPEGPAAQGAGWLDDMTVRTPSPRLNRLLQSRVERFNRMTPNEAFSTVAGELLDLAPTMMFALMPVFALVLKLLYARRKRFYVEHFVFALHVHAFVFLLATVLVVIGNDALGSVVGMAIFPYIYLAMKRVYGQGWVKTGVKFVVLGIAYNFLMLVAGLLTLFASILLA